MTRREAFVGLLSAFALPSISKALSAPQQDRAVYSTESFSMAIHEGESGVNRESIRRQQPSPVQPAQAKAPAENDKSNIGQEDKENADTNLATVATHSHTSDQHEATLPSKSYRSYGWLVAIAMAGAGGYIARRKVHNDIRHLRNESFTQALKKWGLESPVVVDIKNKNISNIIHSIRLYDQNAGLWIKEYNDNPLLLQHSYQKFG